MEAIVTNQIPATAKERRLTVESVLHQGRQEGRQEAMLALASQLLTPAQLANLEAIEDPAELELRLVELLRRH
jgi:hypothetical protein